MSDPERWSVIRWPSIEGRELRTEDVGRRVLYTAYDGAEPEAGVITSFRSTGSVFVRFRGPGGESTPTEKLRWYPAEEGK